jgi:hypothetical protein
MKHFVWITCTIVLAACAVLLIAEPAKGVVATLIGRGTYEPFKVKTSDHDRDWERSERWDHNRPHSLLDFEAKSKTPVDMVVQTHDYKAGSTTGWHTHPGPVFITVTKGELTFYEVDDPNCSPRVVRAGEGYVDTGHGHIGRNETTLEAQDVTVAIAPVGAPFRTDLPAPGPYCPF